MIGVSQLPEELAAPINALSGGPGGNTPSPNPLAGAPSSPQPSDAGAPDSLSGGLPIRPMAPNTEVTSPEKPLTFGEKLGRAADTLGIPANQPGGWAKSLVGAAQSVLAGVGNIGKVPEGAGGLYGVGKVMQYQQEQKAQQQARQDKLNQQAVENKIAQQRADDEHNAALGLDPKSKAMIGHENAQMVYEQTLTHQIGDAEIQRSVDDGTKLFNNLTSGENPAPVIAKDLTSGELQTQLAQNKINPTEVHAYPTGRKVVGEDKDGNPITQTTYSVAGNVPSKKIDAQTASFLNKYLPGQNIQEGQELTGAQFGTLTQQASSVAAATAARNKTIEDAGGDAKKLEEVNLGPEWNNALANAKNDPFRALTNLENNPTVKQKYPNLASDVMQAYGGPKEWESMRENRVKDAIEQQKVNQEKVTEAGSIIPDDVKAKIANLKPDQQAVLNKYPNEAGAIMAVALGPGDLDFDKIFPVRLTKGAPGINAQTAINAIKAINPNWSEQQYKQMGTAFKDITTGPIGKQVSQYNNVLKHAAILQDTLDNSSRAKNPRFLNTAINAVQTQGWGDEATKINTEVTAVKDEYEGLMNAGYKPSDTEQQIYNQIVNGSATLGQVKTFNKAVGAVGAVRFEGLNDQYKRLSGQNVPGMLTKDTMDAARRLNLDSDTMRRLSSLDVGGSIFHNPDWKPASQTDIQQQTDNQQAQKVAQQAAAVAALPPTVVSRLKEGVKTTLGNGQVWTLQNGKPVLYQGQ